MYSFDTEEIDLGALDLSTINEINIPDLEEWQDWVTDMEIANTVSEATTIILAQTYECDYSNL